MGLRIQAVLFDAVGTLITPTAPIGDLYATVAAEHGLSVNARALEDAFRRVFPAMRPMAFPGAAHDTVPALERAWWRELVGKTFLLAVPDASEGALDAVFPTLFERFAHPEVWRARPGTRRALRATLDSGRRCAVLSNFDHRLHRVLAGMELNAFFEFVLLPGEVGAAKPDPLIFRVALEKLGLPANVVALVGDHERDDLGGARAAGMRGVDVRQLATLADLEARLGAIEDET